MPRALLSVSDKTGVVDLGRGLAARGFELVSTGGTARALSEAGLAVTSVSVADRLSRNDGRPRQDAAPEDSRRHPRAPRPSGRSRRPPQPRASGSIDLVVVNLIRSPRPRPGRTSTFDELVEQIDIGGPSMVRAAAKNFRDVLVVVDPADYPRLLPALDEGPDARVSLRADAEGVRAHRRVRLDDRGDAAAPSTVDGDRFERAAGDRGRDAGRPPRLRARKIRDLRYGENPHQPAAWYRARRRARARSRHAGRLRRTRRRSSRARSCRTRTSSTSTRPRGSCSSSTSRPRSWSSTPTRAAPPRAIGRRRLRARPRRRQPRGLRRHRRAEPAARRRGRRGDRLDVHRGGDRAGG